MAVNLTPKADATLVNQSYRMGMAGVPQDLSRTFDGISRSYSSAMGEVGRAGAIVGEQVGQLAGEGLKIAIQNIKDNNTGLDDLSDTYSLDARQGIVDELQKLKKGNNLFIDDDGDPETNKVLNPRYIPFSKKGKEAREEFRRKKNIAIKDLKAMQDGTFMNATAIEQNAIVQDGSSQQEWVMNNAIASKGYPLKEGDYAGVSAKSFYKDVDGEQRQHFMLVKDGKEVMIGDNGAIVEVTKGQEGAHTAATDIGSLIKKKDANVAPNLIKIQEAVYNNSLKGLDFQANVIKSGIINNIKTNDQAATAFHSNELGLDISYAQALEGENEITGEMFVGLLDVNKDGKVDDTETSFAGLEGDFSTAENMIKLKKAMLDPNNSKSRDIFANWATSELTKVHENGNKTYTDKLNAKNSKSSSGKSNYVLGGKTIRQDQLPSIQKDLTLLDADPDNIPVQNSWNGTQWQKVDGQYQVYDRGEDEFIDKTKDDIARGYLQFDESIGYTTTGPTTTPAEIKVPKDFDKAFRDDDEKVVQYFKNNPNLYPGMKVEETTDDDPEDGTDTFRITMPNGTSKVFTADPLVGDKKKMKNVWEWINSNYENNEFAK